MQPYKPPTFGETAFNCARCRAYAEQTWWTGTGYEAGKSQQYASRHNFPEFTFSFCQHCKNATVWLTTGGLIYPPTSVAPTPNEDLPESVRADYEEAAAIVDRSPRGAAALLRLALQKLAEHIVNRKGNLNELIGDLVSAGLPKKVQKAMDVLRVIGNEAVHPGTLDLRDDGDTAMGLFGLVNITAQSLISESRQIDELYERLPDRARTAIEERDS